MAIPLVTEDEFLSLPESLDKIELIDGELFVSPSPSGRHQVILMRISAALYAWAEKQHPPASVAQAPLDIRFRDGRILQPDVMLFFEDVSQELKGPMTIIPALCVEVLSPSSRGHDRVTKRFVYAEAGVREYWIVDTVGRFERFSGKGLEEREEIEEALTTELLPGFALSVSTLLR